MGKERIKLGIVGAGFMSQLVHLPCFKSLDNCEVVAVAAKRKDRRDKVADKFGIPRCYQSHLDLAADKDIEAVVVSVPPEYNPGIAVDLLRAGKHLFTEKPMALSVGRGEEMVRVAKEKGLKLMVGYMKRYDPGVQRAKEFAEGVKASGEWGNIIFARGHCFLGGDWLGNIENLGKVILSQESAPEYGERDPGPGWMPQEHKANLYGFANPFYAFNHVHCHNINLMRYFLGDNLKVSYVDYSKDVRLIVFDVEAFLADLEVGGPISAHDFDEDLKIYYNHGWLYIRTPPPLLRNVPARVEIYQAGKRQELIQAYSEWDWSFRRQAEHFLDCVLKDKEPISSGEDSVKDLRVVEAIFRKVFLG